MTQRSFLIDTHIIYWLYTNSEKLSFAEKEIIASQLTDIYVSPISLMEIATKFGRGKADLHGWNPERVLQQLYEDGIQMLPLYPEDAISYYHLTWHKDHRDPFDRMLAYQAIRNNLTFITHDGKMSRYAKDGLVVF
jgi:PIN domain nuclease of toxin-antitoxin system